jgi:initiation factor 1A
MSGRNIRGGKAFKKGKKGPKGVEEKEEKFVGREADQDYARVMRLLGDRRVLCFCNDGKERICKIRGALCKGPNKQIIGEGDIVLISFRDYGDSDDSETDVSGGASETPKTKKKADVADILHRFSSKHQHSIRKEEGIHRNLFLVVATAAGTDDTLVFEEDDEAGAAAAAAAAADEEIDIGAI